MYNKITPHRNPKGKNFESFKEVIEDEWLFDM
jgi:hypothetical protein